MINIYKQACFLSFSLVMTQIAKANELFIRGTVYAKKESGQLVEQYFSDTRDEKTPPSMFVTIKESETDIPITKYGIYSKNISSQFKAGDKITLDVKKPGWKVTHPHNGKVIIPRDPKAKTDIILEEMNIKPKDDNFFYSVQLLSVRDEYKAQGLKRDLFT